MKKTDPNNLRRSAVRLLAGLIPQGSRAGIWSFSNQVNMTVKIGTVNDQWRERARIQSTKINSVGLYTNIENALRKVSFDWQKPDPRYKRNLILLTDGHIDVSQDERLNKASRTRILKEILPALEKAQVRIHTIALSDDIDEDLLSTLSAYTDGLYKKVSNADGLQKVFLQMLEQSVNLDSLPIKGNRFNVDPRINDMTLLVFNKDNANPTTIVTPGKRTWDKNSRLAQLKWFNDDGFDLITINKPQPGQWKIMAPVDDSNRVVVATNLKLKLSKLPGYVMLGDIVNVNVQLQQDGKPLSEQRLLSQFKFSLTIKREGSVAQEYSMLKSEAAQSNYSYQLPPIFKQGIYELTVKAKSPTAEREVRYQFKAYATPAKIKIIEKKEKYVIKVIPHTNLLRPNSIKINLKFKDSNNYEFSRQGEEWLLEVDKKHHQSMFSLNIEAVRADGKLISVNFNKVLAAYDSAQSLTMQVEKSKAKSAPPKATKDTKQSKHTATNKTAAAEEKDSEINWTLIIISIVVGNLLIIAVLGGGYVYMRRRKAKIAATILDEMDEDDRGKVESIKENNK